MANNNERRWSVPSKRAKGYAEERKAKVHQHGPKEGKELTDYEAGMRSGYLQAQSDHAGLFKYKKALAEGKTKAEAKKISRLIQLSSQRMDRTSRKWLTLRMLNTKQLWKTKLL